MRMSLLPLDHVTVSLSINFTRMLLNTILFAYYKGIGQRFAMLEEKSIISTMIRNFKWKSLQKRGEIKMLQELVLRPVGGINLQFERRQ